MKKLEIYENKLWKISYRIIRYKNGIIDIDLDTIKGPKLNIESFISFTKGLPWVNFKHFCINILDL